MSRSARTKSAGGGGKSVTGTALVDLSMFSGGSPMGGSLTFTNQVCILDDSGPNQQNILVTGTGLFTGTSGAINFTGVTTAAIPDGTYNCQIDAQDCSWDDGLGGSGTCKMDSTTSTADVA